MLSLPGLLLLAAVALVEVAGQVVWALIMARGVREAAVALVSAVVPKAEMAAVEVMASMVAQEAAAVGEAQLPMAAPAVRVALAGRLTVEVQQAAQVEVEAVHTAPGLGVQVVAAEAVSRVETAISSIC